MLRRERQLVVPLQGLNQVREKGRQAFGAQIVARFPELLEHRAKGAHVLRGPPCPLARPLRRVAQEANGHFPMPVGDAAELIQETTFVAA